MSNVGQAIFGIGGAIVGAFFGNPAAGFALGSIAGNLLFPTKGNAPKVGDLSFASANEGTPIALLFGTMALPGSLIWAKPIEVRQSSSGGKGGPSQTTNSYFFTGAFLLCEGPVAGYLRIWSNEKLVVDLRPGVDDSGATVGGDPVDDFLLAILSQNASSQAWISQHVTFYNGDLTQLADPTIEAYEGAGNVPAFRGRCYIVIRDLDVTDIGARPPAIKVEVVRNGVGSTDASTTLAANVLYPWDAGAADPRNCQNDHEYRAPYNGAPWRTVLADAQADYIAYGTVVGTGLDGTVDSDSFIHLLGWSPDYVTISTAALVSPGEHEFLYLHFNRYSPATYRADWDAGGDTYLACGPMFNNGYAIGDPQFWWQAQDTGQPPISPARPGVWRLKNNLDPLVTGEYAVNNCIDYPSIGGLFPQAVCYADRAIIVRRIPRHPDAPCTPRCTTPFPNYPGTTDYCVIDGKPVANTGYTMVGTTGGAPAYRWLADYFDSNDDADHPAHPGVSGTVTQYPLAPVLAIGDANDTSTYWTAAYAAAVTAGTLPGGMTYATGNNTDPTKYPITKPYAWEHAESRILLTPTIPTVGEICAELCARSGLDSSLYDFSALTKLVWGYAIGRLSATREMIQPLLDFSFSNVTESNGQLVGVVRGGASVLTLTDDDLAAHEAGQGDTPPKTSITRLQPIELPRVLRLHYIDNSNDYQPGLQPGFREYGPARAPQDVELAIAMSPDEAAQCVEITLNEAYIGREPLQIAIAATDANLALTPADDITVAVEGRDRLYRITELDYAFPGLITLQLARTDLDLYSSSATGTSTAGATAAIAPVGPTALTILDLPALTTTVNDAGVYVAARSLLAGEVFPGATIFESKDAGATYEERTTITAEGSIGTIRAPLPTGSETVIDNTTTLAVDLQSGTLASVAESALAAGLNAFALGAPGRWTIIQARDCVLQIDGSYLLGGLLQGLNGTQANRGTSIAGDAIVLLDSRLRRVPESVSEIGQTRLLRAVGAGTALADAVDVSFVVSGLSYTAALTGSAPAGSVVIGAAPGSTPGSPTAYVAPGTPGALFVDQGAGVAPAFKAMSGDGAIDHTGAFALPATGVSADSYAFASLTLDAKGRASAAIDAHATSAKTAPVDADELPLIDSAASFGPKKLSWANLKAAIWSALGSLISGGTAKTVPVDADELVIADSASSYATKALLWANVKSTLKTYFDTLYVIAGAITSSGLQMNTAKLLGRSTAGAGAIEEIAIGSGLSLSGGTLSASGGAIVGVLGAAFDQKGSVMTASSAGVVYFRAPRSGTISRWTISGDTVPGSASFDVYKDTSYPPAVSITGSVQPSISAASAVTSTTLTGWTTAVTAGDWIGVKLLTCSAFRYLNLEIEYA